MGEEDRSSAGGGETGAIAAGEDPGEARGIDGGEARGIDGGEARGIDGGEARETDGEIGSPLLSILATGVVMEVATEVVAAEVAALVEETPLFVVASVVASSLWRVGICSSSTFERGAVEDPKSKTSPTGV